MAILLEVCVDGPEGVMAAARGGAQRLELCSALALGGLTPGAALVALAHGQGLPVAAMIRPRPGDFVWTREEADFMAAEIDEMQELGVAAVVIGASLPDGRLDSDLLARLIGRLGARTAVVLHRAFDLCPDPVEALDTAIGLGFDRILTSGGAPRAVDALDRLALLADRAAGRITLMPGGGVTPETAPAICAALPVTEIHASCARTIPQDPRAVALGFTGPDRRETDEAVVRTLGTLLQSFGEAGSRGAGTGV